MKELAPSPLPYFLMKCALLWITFAKDLPFFRASVASFKKFAHGWDYAKVIVPNSDVAAFREVCDPAGIFVSGIDEPPGKGMVMHMAMQMLGDTHFPADTNFISHIDADCVFNQPTSPADYIVGGKPVLCFQDFENLLTRPVDPDEMLTFMGFTGRTIDFQRGAYLWKFAADFALGFPVMRQTMTRMPITHVREVYSVARNVIKARFGTDIISHVTAGRNEWPQQFCEFETLGGIAHRFFPEKYIWHNIAQSGYPQPTKVTQTWSHSGLWGKFEQDRPQIIAGVHQSPGEYFQSLGLL